MNINNILVTGSGGLIGSEVVEFYCNLGCNVLGIDNNSRSIFFGSEGSVQWRVDQLLSKYKNYSHSNVSICDKVAIDSLLKNKKFDLIIHAAAQPSHDWAVKDPIMDFTTNAMGTLIMLEAYKKYSPCATFIFTSTNKVYGDKPNSLQYTEVPTRWTPSLSDIGVYGIDEYMSIDNCLHSLFGASKASADLLVQEYGKYFKLNTGVFRGGCLTGPNHSGVELHGFLSYLIKCSKTDKTYNINGYKGKQVRDNIHSKDMINAFHEFALNPTQGEVYNIGGGPDSNCSIIEAIDIIEQISGKIVKTTYTDNPRIGDHIWWISDTRKFKRQYPNWCIKYNIHNIIEDIIKNS